jgi:hypothetical protein
MSKVVARLSWLLAALAVPAAALGLFWSGSGGPVPFTTARGQLVELYGRGLYHYDTLFGAGGARGTDAVVLFVGVPLLVASTLAYRRAGLRAALLHSGVLLFFLYVYASAALGTVAYNPAFPLYVALFGVSLFAFVSTVAGVDRTALGRTLAAAPRRGPAAFLAVSGLVTLLVWAVPLASALLARRTPERLDSYPTPLTFALDLGVIVPATFVAAVNVRRGAAVGWLVAVPLLVLETMLAPMIAAQTVGQVAAGVSFPIGQVVGPIAGFLTIAVLAGWFLVAILRRPGTPPVRPASAAVAHAGSSGRSRA